MHRYYTTRVLQNIAHVPHIYDVLVWVRGRVCEIAPRIKINYAGLHVKNAFTTHGILYTDYRVNNLTGYTNFFLF